MSMYNMNKLENEEAVEFFKKKKETSKRNQSW